MKIYFVLIFLIPFFNFTKVYSQIKAVTENGDEVMLSSDGTWVFINKNDSVTTNIKKNETKFVKSPKASFFVKSSRLNAGVNLNPKEWKFKKQDEDAEYFFQHKELDLYGMLITESIQISIENLKDIALENAQKVAPDAKISQIEYRTVNGTEVLLLQIDGTIKGTKFTYYGYYFSNESGTVQFVSYTGSNLFKKHQAELELFLNGFTVN